MKKWSFYTMYCYFFNFYVVNVLKFMTKYDIFTSGELVVHTTDRIIKDN